MNSNRSGDDFEAPRTRQATTSRIAAAAEGRQAQVYPGAGRLSNGTHRLVGTAKERIAAQNQETRRKSSAPTFFAHSLERLVQPPGSPGSPGIPSDKLHDQSVSARERSFEMSMDFRSRGLVQPFGSPGTARISKRKLNDQ